MISRHRVSVRSRLLATGSAVAFVVSSCGGSNSGATAESWCDFADESDVVDEVFESLGDDPTQIEAGLKRVEGFLDRLPDEAPDEIADAAKVLADGTQLLIDAFADADYNLLDADLSFMSDSELEANLEGASDTVDAYTERECGRPFGDNTETDSAPADAPAEADDDATEGDAGDDDSADDNSADDGAADDGAADDDAAGDSDFDPANGTLREQLIVQFESIGLTTEEAACIADNLDFGDPNVQSGDIGAMLDVFEECGIGLDRLAELGG